MEDILVRYLHFIGIIFLSGTLVFSHLLTSVQMSNENFKKVCRVDVFYGLSALLVLITGLLLWLALGKDASFYSKNPIFHIKFTLFILMALVSIYPTMFYIKNRKSEEEVINVPKKIIMMQRVQLLFLLIIPCLAVLMANGYGLKG